MLETEFEPFKSESLQHIKPTGIDNQIKKFSAKY